MQSDSENDDWIQFSGHAVGWGDGLTDSEVAMLMVLAEDNSITINDQSIKNAAEGITKYILRGRKPFDLWMGDIEQH